MRENKTKTVTDSFFIISHFTKHLALKMFLAIVHAVIMFSILDLKKSTKTFIWLSPTYYCYFKGQKSCHELFLCQKYTFRN